MIRRRLGCVCWCRVGLFLRNLVLFLMMGNIIQSPAMAVTNLGKDDLDIYARNQIYFYKPGSGCIPAATTNGKSDGSDVYLIGDSMSVYSTAKIKENLPNITIDARSGTYFSRDDDTFGPSGISRIREMGDQEILVFAMGTNGGVSNSDIEKLFSALSGKNIKIILMTIFYGGHKADGQMNDTNSVVKTVATSNANVSFFDWYSVASSDEEKYIAYEDGFRTHPTSDGQEAFAELIKTAVNQVTSMTGKEESSGSSSSGGAYERLKNATREYGEFAMKMQIEYGTPWEVVMAQMQIESGVGTAGHAVDGAENNWLGITGSGDNGSYYDSNNRAWAKFSSVEKSIEAWAGAYVLRNGYYNDAFPYLDPDNWDLEAFLVHMIAHYAPSSDGNNERRYVELILDLVNGPIKEVREEKGWLSSGDFAKTNNIPVGGNHPLEVKVDRESTSANTSYSSSSACKNGNNYDQGGVTSLIVDGVDYAFPVAHATKSNYLNNTTEHPSSLSSKMNNWYHHDYPAVDLGIYFKDITGKDFAISDYPQWNKSYLNDAYLGKCSSSYGVEHCNSSTGAPVVAITDGYIGWYDHYRGTSDRPLAKEDSDYCAQMSFHSTVGTQAVYYYIHIGYEEEFANMVNKEVKAGDVIGHIGPSPCAQYTQAHLHFQTADESEAIKELIDVLYDALPEK